jgi:hypothetical protein
MGAESLIGFFDAYLRYSLIAGNALVSGVCQDWNFAPQIFEFVHEGLVPLSFQFGPYFLEKPEQICSIPILTAVGNLVGKALEMNTSVRGSHSIYFGYCGPLRGPGLTTLFVWAPSFVRSRAEMLKIKHGLCNDIKSRFDQKATPIFTYNLNIIVHGQTTKTPLTDDVVAITLGKSGSTAGSNGILPMLWCADPARSTSRHDSRCPIVPIMFYTKHIADENGDMLDHRIEHHEDLVDCESVHNSFLMGTGFPLPARVEVDDTPAQQSRFACPNAIVRSIGCRALNNPTVTTYDTLPFVISSGFSSRKVGAVLTDISTAIFGSCTAETKNVYNVRELLSLLSVDRFNTSTIEGLALLSELIEAILAEEIAENPTMKLTKACQIIKNAALSAGAQASDFDVVALAKHHSQNYEKRPKRSRRVIAHYAQLDSPARFADLLASRIWEKLISIIKKDQTVDIAEALATFMMVDHYITSDPIKTNVHLYKFKNSIFAKIEDPTNYLSGLLSPDHTCGKLYALLQKFVARVNILLTSAIPGDCASQVSGGPGAGAGIVPGETSAATTGYLTTCAQAITDVLKSLRSSTYKNTLVKELLGKIHQEQTMFLHVSGRSVNDDPYVIGLKNGVIEAVRVGGRRKLFYRQGTPDDMVTHFLNACYDTSVRGSRKWEIIETYFRRFLACPRTRKWYICQLAEIFVAQNNKIAVFIVGPTDAGKSIHISHLKGFLGEGMGESIASNVLSDPKAGTDCAQPALTRASAGRFMFCEETSDIIRNNIFKVIAGGTAETSLRTLYKEGSGTNSFRAKAIFALNRHPRFELYEEAVFTRMAIIEPDARYLDANNPNLPKTEAERNALRIFQKDPSYSAVVRDSYDALLLYLMDHFDAWTDVNGEHAELSAFTDKMKQGAARVRAQCPYSNFASRFMLKAGSDRSVTVKETFAHFRKNCSTSCRGISEETFVPALSGILGFYPCEGSWIGWTLVDSYVQPPGFTPVPERAGANSTEWEDNGFRGGFADISNYFIDTPLNYGDAVEDGYEGEYEEDEDAEEDEDEDEDDWDDGEDRTIPRLRIPKQEPRPPVNYLLLDQPHESVPISGLI